MFFYKNIKLIILISLIAILTSCKSYEIPYDKNISSSQIATGIYVTETPAPSASFTGGALIIIGKIALHEKEIVAAYAETNLRDIFYQELTKNGQNISPKLIASIKTPEEKNMVITEIPGASDKDPKANEFVFEEIPQKIGKDYMLIMKVTDYGFSEGGFSINSKIGYVASITDMRNNTKIWQMRSTNESSYPMMSSFSVAKNPDSVRENLRDCVVGVVQQISKDINKKVK